MMLSINEKSPRVVFHEIPSYSPPGLRILCATDLSVRSDHAIERALRMSESLGAQCMLLHVVTDDVPMRLAGRRAERAHGGLLWHVRRFSHLQTKPTVSVRVGNRYSTIARAAKEWGANLIILGTHRRRPMDSWRWSTAERILRQARCPVLVVNTESSRDYSSVTFVARSNVGAYVRLTDQFELFDTAHVAVVPPANLIDRALLACSAMPGTAGAATKLLRRFHHRTHLWLEDAGLHLMGFEIVTPPISAHSVLSRVHRGNDPQLLVAEVSHTSRLTRGLAREAAITALRSGLCDVLIASEGASRAVVRMPLFSPRRISRAYE